MSDWRLPPPPPLPSRRRWVAITAASSVTAVVAGLALLVERGGPSTPCPDGVVTSVAPAQRIQLLMAQPAENAPAQAAAAARAFRPIIERSVRTGSAISLVIDRGEGGALEVDECLNGSRLFEITRGNPQREQQDLATTVDALTTHVQRRMTDGMIAPNASPLRILQRGAADAAAARQDGLDVLSVAVFSDFIGNNNDCLGVPAREATAEVIADVILRCEQRDELPAIPARVELLGVGSSTRTAGFENWARALAAAVCDVTAPKNCDVR